MVPVGEGSGLIRWPMSGMLMVSGEIWAWTGLTGDSGTFLGSFLSLERAVNVILILVLGNRKQHLQAGEEPPMREHTLDIRRRRTVGVRRSISMPRWCHCAGRKSFLLPGNKRVKEVRLKLRGERLYSTPPHPSWQFKYGRPTGTLCNTSYLHLLLIGYIWTRLLTP